MTILTKDAVGNYPLPIGGSAYIAPTDARVIATVSEAVSVVSIINTGSWGSEVGTRVWYDLNWPGKYVWVAIPPESGFWNITYDYYGYEVTYTTVPATAGVPFVPAAIDAIALAAYYNEGWNTWARSIALLPTGHYLEVSVAPSSAGAMVYLGYAGNESVFGTPLTNQGFSVVGQDIQILDSDGVATTFGTNTPSTRMFIYRLNDGKIAFRVGDYYHINIDTLGSYKAVYAYGMLFRAFDSIIYAAIGTASITEVAHVVSLTASSRLLASTGTTARFPGLGTLLVPITKLVESNLTGTGYLLSEVDRLTRGTGDLPLYVGLGADYAYGMGAGDLPSYTQPQIMPEYGWATLTYFSGYAYGSDHDVGGGTGVLPRYCGLGADYAYGFGADGTCGVNGLLPLYTGGGVGGVDGELVLFNVVRAEATATLAIDLVLVLTSTGAIGSAFSMTREQAISFVSSVTGGDQYTFVGTFSMSMLSSLRGSTLQISTIGDRADLQSSGVVWVVNLDTKASSQYEDYGFNSFFNRNGQAYGVAADGIYSLGGDMDASAYIAALVDLGKTNLGTSKVKYVPNVYMGLSSTDKMVLKVVAGSQTYYYTARNSATEMRNQRFEIGKGLSANYWQLVIENSNGCDFELAEIEFTPITSSRRI